MIDYTLYAYGSGEFLARVFETLKYLFEGGFAISLLKVFAIVSILTALITWGLRLLGSTFVGDYSYVSDDYSNASGILAILRTGILAVIATTIFINPVLKVPLIIEDRYEPSQSRVVDDVPWGFAFTASVLSQIGDKFGEAVETMLAPVDGVKMREGGGIGVGPKFLNYMLKIDAPGSPSEYGYEGDVPIKGVMDAWFNECIYPKFATIQGENDVRAQALRALATSGYILGEMVFMQPPFADPNTPLSVQFYGPGEQNETTCANAMQQILEKWSVVFEPWLARQSAFIFNKREDDPSVAYRAYEIVDRYFPDSRYSTWERIAQLATLNNALAAFVKFSAEYGSMGAQALAIKKQTESWVQMAKIGAKSLFVLRQIAEAVLYLFGALMPIFIVTAGIGVIFKYIKYVFWLQLWIPIFAIFNALGDYHMAKSLEEISQCTGGSCYVPLNFETVSKIMSQTNFILGYLGILTMSAPAIAFGIIKGSEAVGGAVSSMIATKEAGMTASAAVTQRTGALAGYDAGSKFDSFSSAMRGSISYGLTSKDFGLGVQNLTSMRDVELQSHMFQTARQIGALGIDYSSGIGQIMKAGAVEEAGRIAQGEPQAPIPALQKALSIATGKQMSMAEAAGWHLAGVKATALPNQEGYFLTGYGSPDTKMFVGNDGTKMVTKWGGGFESHVQGAMTLLKAKDAVMSNETSRSYLLDKGKQFFSGEKLDIADKTANSLMNNFTQSFTDEIAKNKALMERLGITDQTRFQTTYSAETGLNLGKLTNGVVTANFGMKMERGQATIYNKETGQEITLTDSERQALQTAYTTAQTKAIENTLATSQGFQDFYKLAKNENAKVGEIISESYRSSQEYTKNFRGDLAPAVGNIYMKQSYGEITPDNISKVEKDFAVMSAKGDYSRLTEIVGLANPELFKQEVEKMQGAIQNKVENKTEALVDKTKNVGNVKPITNTPRVEAPKHQPDTKQFQGQRWTMEANRNTFTDIYKLQTSGSGQYLAILGTMGGLNNTPTLDLDKTNVKPIVLKR